MTRTATPVRDQTVTLWVNAHRISLHVPVRLLLADMLREDVGLTGTHLGCEHGVCGACTILLDGEPVRSCLLLAVQADGARVETVEGLADGERLHPIQEAFRQTHGLQCGFCTPGILMTVAALLDRTPGPTDHEIEEALGGHLCRCTGYVNILKAVRRAADIMTAEGHEGRTQLEKQGRKTNSPGGGNRV